MNDFTTDQEFELFRNLIYEHSGISFSASNRSILESRLRERLKITKLDHVMDYHELITRDKEETKTLLDSVTTNLTRFFRNASHFETFQKFVIPDLVAHKKNRRENRVKIWSAGCSTGEEPYSVSIALMENLPSHLKPEILGSDLSLKSLMTAKEGFYRDGRIDGIPPPYLAKYFDRKRDGYQAKDLVKQTIKFDYHNLKYDSGLSGVDCVFCRNVLIYFDSAAQQASVNRIWNVMTAHSFLFIGHSESLFGMDTKFEFHKTEWGTIYRKSV